MSDTYLKFIPLNPLYTPDISSQMKMLEKLKVIFEKSEIKIKLHDHVQFIDQGENFDSIICPNCHVDVEINWWQEKMDIANETILKMCP